MPGTNLNLNFIFWSPTKVVFGENTALDVAIEVENLKCKKALIVTDKDLVSNTDLPERIRKTLGNLCAGIFSDVEPDSGIHIVNQGAKFGAGRGADCLVSVGGGSAIDTAKGMAILMKEGGRLQDYAGFQVLTRPQTPHVVIPTTAGTGSEATYIAVIKDHQEGRKLLFGDYNILPNVAILDPRMTEGLPPKLTAATGMDAMCHAIEALHSLQREPVADGLALHAIRLIKEFLPRAVENGKDMMARGQMLIAANMAGSAFSNAQEARLMRWPILWEPYLECTMDWRIASFFLLVSDTMPMRAKMSISMSSQRWEFISKESSPVKRERSLQIRSPNSQRS